MSQITLKELLQYYEPKEEYIQVCVESDGGWGNYIEVPAGSAFLKPFLSWYIVAMGAEEDDSELSKPIVRVEISKENNHA